MSRLISEGLQRGEVSKASQSCAIIIMDESVNESVSSGMGWEAVFTAVTAGRGSVVQGFGETAVEALGHAVGLGLEWPCEAVADAIGLADAVEGMAAGWDIFLFPICCSEAIGELGAVIGQHRMNWMSEGIQKAAEASGDGLGVAPFDDLGMDEAGGTFDGNEDISLCFVQARQMFEIDVNEAERLGVETARLCLGRPFRPADAVALEAAMNGTAGQLGVHAALHDFGKIVEGQAETASEFEDEVFLDWREADGEPFWRVRAVLDGGSIFPAPDGCLADAEFERKRGDGGGTLLDIGPGLGRGGGVGVQSHLHEAKRSLRKRMPRSTPILSRQSSGT